MKSTRYRALLPRANLDTPKTQNIHYRNLSVKETAHWAMQFPREYVAYMAKQVLKRLTGGGLIQFDQSEYVNEVMLQVILDELSVEDRINDEVRKILQQHDSEMKQYGATYEEAFKAIKKQLVRDRKVIL
jgi:hypothetical protein